jgi:RsiW-degrading membrane proteinase PrsW (M82 family)
MDIFFYILLGLAPSIIWLLFYLRKDAHPESNSMVAKTFILGMLLAPLALGGELLLSKLIDFSPISLIVSQETELIVKLFLLQAVSPGIIEEILKFAAVKFKSLKSSEFDEPVDVLIYCIIVGLGFAAVENLLTAFSYPVFSDAVKNIIFRFWGATLLHAIATGMIGYWLAQAIRRNENRKSLIAVGVLIAIFFHICYNGFITLAEFKNFTLIAVFGVVVLLITGTTILSYQFKRLKKQKSICKITPKKIT